MVGPGQGIVQLVPTGDLWITGNFKETQIHKMRVGQPAHVEVDAFPGVTLHGEVESFSAATGARFTLLPPDNASGNYTKVVQRVPVRIHAQGHPHRRRAAPGHERRPRRSTPTSNRKRRRHGDRRHPRSPRSADGPGGRPTSGSSPPPWRCGALLEVVDTSIVNVALNEMQNSLGATLSEVSWVVSSYAVANVIILPMTAWLGDRFGKKRYFIFSLIAFTLASVLCGIATNLPMLIFARVLQGLGGGGLLAKAQAILFETFPREEQAMAQGFFGAIVIAGPAIGPTLGGYLVTNVNWRWIFFVNVPVGIAAVFMCLAFLPEDEERDKATDAAVDWVGHRPPDGRARARSRRCSKRGSRRTGSPRASSSSSSILAVVGLVLLRVARAHGRPPRRRPAGAPLPLALGGQHPLDRRRAWRSTARSSRCPSSPSRCSTTPRSRRACCSCPAPSPRRS